MGAVRTSRKDHHVIEIGQVYRSVKAGTHRRIKVVGSVCQISGKTRIVSLTADGRELYPRFIKSDQLHAHGYYWGKLRTKGYVLEES
jgi:hypothetical protein